MQQSWKEGGYDYKPGDLVGQDGLERVYELYLRGEDGEQLIETNYLGQPINYMERKEPTPGNNLIPVSYTHLDVYKRQPLEDAVLTLLAPVQKMFARAGTNIQYFFDTVAQFQQFKAENEHLKKEITLLESRLLYLQELQKENHRYRELLEFRHNSGFELLPAEVIARDQMCIRDRDEGAGERAYRRLYFNGGASG